MMLQQQKIKQKMFVLFIYLQSFLLTKHRWLFCNFFFFCFFLYILCFVFGVFEFFLFFLFWSFWFFPCLQQKSKNKIMFPFFCPVFVDFFVNFFLQNFFNIFYFDIFLWTKMGQMGKSGKNWINWIQFGYNLITI